MGQAAAYMGNLVGWSGNNAAGEEQKEEEVKDEGNDSFEESKEEGEPQEAETTGQIIEETANQEAAKLSDEGQKQE